LLFILTSIIIVLVNFSRIDEQLWAIKLLFIFGISWTINVPFMIMNLIGSIYFKQGRLIFISLTVASGILFYYSIKWLASGAPLP
jgi:hypothetical protein